MTAPRWMMHLPTRLTSLDAAATLVEQLSEALATVTVIDFAAATLSEKDRLMVRHPVFCDRPMPGRLRCVLRNEHTGPCVPLPGRDALAG